MMPMCQIRRVIFLNLGWLASSFSLLYCLLLFDADWDLFSWSPKCNLLTVGLLVIIVALEIGAWYLARASRDQASRVVSLLVCLVLGGMGAAYLFPPDTQGFFFTRLPSPFWFRGGLTVLAFIPGIWWMWWTWRRLTEARQD